MPIYVRWLVQNQIILVHMVGELGTEQLLPYIDKSFAMRDQANEENGVHGPLVHTITDGRGITKQNIDLKTTQQIMKSLKTQRIGWSIYVSTDRVQVFFASLAHQFGGIRFKSFGTVEEALDFLRGADARLDAELEKGYEVGIIESAWVEGT